MVSRETTRPLRKLVPAAALGLSALLGIVGCSAGQVTQTGDMEPAVNGNTGQVGDLVLRDVLVAFPESGEPYREGEDAPLVLTIVNQGATADELVGVSSPAGKVEIVGRATLPGRSALAVVLPADNPATSAEPETASSSSSTAGSETSGTGTVGTEAPGTETAEPSETAGTVTTTGTSAAQQDGDATPDLVGTISLIITGLTGDLPFGKNVPVTFEFAEAGEVTILLPVGAPATPRPSDRDAPAGEAEEH